jgi:hypothetical protein
MEGLIDASDGWIDGSVSVCLFPDDWEHGTALHCTACSATVPHARARFPNSPTISSTLQKLNAPLIPFLITASCQRRTTTTTTTKTTTTTTKNNTHHHHRHRSRSSAAVLVPTRPQNQTTQTTFFSLSLSLSLYLLSSLLHAFLLLLLSLVCSNFSWLWTDFIIAGFFQQLLESVRALLDDCVIS